MSWVAGVDGCRAGWFRACRHSQSGELAFDVIETAGDLLVSQPRPVLLAIDIPIGLPAAGARACDVEARRILGPRRSSIFPAPVRAAISANSHAAASRATQKIDGRRVSAQAWNIFAKIREVDALLLEADPSDRDRIFEVHPEVSLWAWNEGRPMKAPKRTAAGASERSALAEDWLGKGIVERARGKRLKKDLADDDILDAIALLWTAERMRLNRAGSLPVRPESDEAGLPMRIVY